MNESVPQDLKMTSRCADIACKAVGGVVCWGVLIGGSVALIVVPTSYTSPVAPIVGAVVLAVFGTLMFGAICFSLKVDATLSNQ